MSTPDEPTSYYIGDTSAPLSQDDHDALIATSRNHRTQARIRLLTPLTCGLSQNAVQHLRSDWLRTIDGQLFIHLPHQPDPCTLAEDDSPCGGCRRGRSQIPNNPRRIPVMHDETKGLLQAHFRSNDSINQHPQAIRDIAENAGITASITSESLRNTFGVTLLEKGFTVDEVRRALGIDDTRSVRSRIRALGNYVTLDVNPFTCEAPTADGSPCQHHVGRRTEHCPHHSESFEFNICEAPVANPEISSNRCQHFVSSPTERCFRHTSEHGFPCSVETDYGRPCQMPVDTPSDICHYHDKSAN